MKPNVSQEGFLSSWQESMILSLKGKIVSQQLAWLTRIHFATDQRCYLASQEEVLYNESFIQTLSCFVKLFYR